MLYANLSSLSASLDQIKKISKIDSIYLFICLFIYLSKKSLWYKLYRCVGWSESSLNNVPFGRNVFQKIQFV